MKSVGTVSSGDLRLSLYAGNNTGERPVVLFLHGYPDCAEVWHPVASQLAIDFDLYAYDVRGCGRSDEPDSFEGYAFEYLMQDLAAVIDQISPDAPVHLVAHDWGSFQGWEAVTSGRFDGRIASYTSISGPCLDHVSVWLRGLLQSGSPGKVTYALRQLGKSWYMALFQIPGLAPSIWRRFGDKGWPWLVRRLDKTEAENCATRSRDGANGVNLYRANLRGKLLAPEQRYADIPVQLLVPTKDPFANVDLYDEIEQWCSDFHREDIKAGHWVVTSHPEWIARQIRSFVQTQAAA